MKNYSRERYHRMKERQRQRAAEREIERAAFRRRWINPIFMQFTKDIRDNAAHLQNYLMGARCKLTLVERIECLREFEPSDAPFLAVNNPEARILFHRVATNAIKNWAGPKRCHLVTLAPRRYARPMSVAGDFRIANLKKWVADKMKGYDFVGIVDVAYYSNGGDFGGPVASFHVHLIVFEADEASLQELRRRLNLKHEALTTSAKMMDVELIADGTLGSVVSYMAKESTADYRVFAKKTGDASGWFKAKAADLLDPADLPPLAKRQNKQRGCPKDQLAIRRILRGRHFDEMIFAGGKCEAVLDEIQNALMKDLEDLSKLELKQREAMLRGRFKDRVPLQANPSPWVKIANGYHEARYDEVAFRAACYGEPDSPEFEREEDRLAKLLDDHGHRK